MSQASPYDLDRFVQAQEPVFATALRELTQGRKRSHWMWFIFPQLRGLGFSPMAQHYGIVSRDEAAAYLAHDRLGPRLRQCTEAVLALPGGTALRDVFGSPDDMKFHSSMSLFAAAAGAGLFETALARFWNGEDDPGTRRILLAGANRSG